MPTLKAFALFLGIGAVPVTALVRKAAQTTWTASPSPLTALLIVLAIGTVLFLVAAANSRRWPEHGSLTVSAVAWGALAFFNIHVLRNELIDVGLTRRWHWLAVVVVALGIAIWIANRFDRAGRYVTMFVVVLVPIQGSLMVADLSRLNEPAPATSAHASVDVGTPPSIWLIVLDSHASPRILREIYDIDLGPEISELENAGFRVWDDARSNYTHTLVSVPSILNGETWAPQVVEASYPEMLAGVKADTPLIAALRHAGLTIRMIPGSWSRSGCSEVVDQCIAAPSYDENWYFLIQSTPLPDLFPSALSHPWPVGGLRAIEAIGDLPGSESHFTFVHSLASHQPTIVDENCRPVSALFGRLRHQLPCLHDSLLDAVSSIDLAADVVIITADHGYAIDTISAPPAQWSTNTVHDRFSAFTAISTPNGCEDALPEDLSTAQILPFILNCYGANLSVPSHRFMSVDQLHLGGIAVTELDWDGWSDYDP